MRLRSSNRRSVARAKLSIFARLKLLSVCEFVRRKSDAVLFVCLFKESLLERIILPRLAFISSSAQCSACNVCALKSRQNRKLQTQNWKVKTRKRLIFAACGFSVLTFELRTWVSRRQKWTKLRLNCARDFDARAPSNRDFAHSDFFAPAQLCSWQCALFAQSSVASSASCEQHSAKGTRVCESSFAACLLTPQQTHNDSEKQRRFLLRNSRNARRASDVQRSKRTNRELQRKKKKKKLKIEILKTEANDFRFNFSVRQISAKQSAIVCSFALAALRQIAFALKFSASATNSKVRATLLCESLLRLRNANLQTQAAHENGKLRFLTAKVASNFSQPIQFRSTQCDLPRVLKAQLCALQRQPATNQTKLNHKTQSKLNYTKATKLKSNNKQTLDDTNAHKRNYATTWMHLSINVEQLSSRTETMHQPSDAQAHVDCSTQDPRSRNLFYIQASINWLDD